MFNHLLKVKYNCAETVCQARPQTASTSRFKTEHFVTSCSFIHNNVSPQKESCTIKANNVWPSLSLCMIYKANLQNYDPLRTLWTSWCYKWNLLTSLTPGNG